MSSREVPPGQHSGESPRRGGALAVIALIVSLAALGLSAWTAFRPAAGPSAGTEYTTAQQTDAKATICGAVDVVRKGVALNTNLPSPGGDGDVTGSLAVAANARLALSDGGQYLMARLDPATTAELTKSVKKFANLLMDVGAAATAGAANTDPDQAARLTAVDAESATLTELCK
jgi:hypothetical protein